MASAVNDLEAKLNDIFGKKAPSLSKGVKDFLVQWAPIFSLVVGVLGLLTAVSIWKWAHSTNLVADFESTCVRYGGVNCGAVSGSRLSFWIWISLIAIIVQSVLYLLAYSGLKERTKQGWDYIYYASLFSVFIGVIRLFSDYSPFSSFIFSLVAAAIGFYLLFQLREYYVKSSGRVTPIDPPQDTEKTKSDEISNPEDPTDPLAK